MSLPTGFRIRIHDDVELVEHGRVLVGGSPLRAMRLSPRAHSFLDGLELQVTGPDSALVADRLIDANTATPVLASNDAASATELTVIIPVRDRPTQLDRSLRALEGLEVIVVDDASAHPRAVADVASARGARIIQLDHNLGPAAARNLGLAHVATPFVAFVDSDVVVNAATLIGLTAHFADPSVVLVAPHVRGRAVNARPRWFERYDESTPALGLGERAGVVRPGAAVAWLPSACLVARTDGLAGGFDSALRVGEDVDLVWRLVAARQRVRYDPAFEAHHDARPTLRTWMGRKFVYGTGGAELAARHPDNMATAVLSPTMAAVALGLLARRSWAVPLAAVGTAHAAYRVHSSLPAMSGRATMAMRLALRGLGWTLRQESALVLRHWWPVALTLALVSRPARRVVVTAFLVDVIATCLERPGRPLLLTLAGRRADDLAYGAGLWWGAAQSRSLRCLRVQWTSGR